MAGQYERGTVHLSDYCRSLDHIVCEQLRAIVEFRAERAPMRPDRSFAPKRGIGGGPTVGQAGGFEFAAILLHDRAQVYELVFHVEVEGEQAAMDFVERLAQGLDPATLPEAVHVHRDRNLEA